MIKLSVKTKKQILNYSHIIDRLLHDFTNDHEDNRIRSVIKKEINVYFCTCYGIIFTKISGDLIYLDNT